MKNPFPLDHPFDPEKFSTLLRKAMGTQTQRAFSQQCNISNSYLSKYINRQLDRPPVPSTILGIAAVADNDVTAADLLDAAGYKFNDTAEIQSTIPLVPKQALAYYKLAPSQNNVRLRGIILNALETLSCQKISVESAFNFNAHLLTRAIRNAPIDLWQFHYIEPLKLSSGFTPDVLSFTHSKISTALGQLLLDLGQYNAIQNSENTTLLHPAYKHPKLSFVVTDENSFNLILHYKNLPFLHLLVSVILADLKSFTILKEEYMSTDIPSAEYEHDPSITFGL